MKEALLHCIYSGYGLLTAMVIGVFLGAVLLARLMKTWKEHRGRKFRKRGKKAEIRAARLLKKAGYTIEEREPRVESVLRVGDSTESFEITPDYRVSRGDETLYVEVKSHGDYRLIYQAQVRRQLVEYIYATGAPCLLVTTKDSTITRIDFPEEN
jgi:Holliday junction resolvase